MRTFRVVYLLTLILGGAALIPALLRADNSIILPAGASAQPTFPIRGQEPLVFMDDRGDDWAFCGIGEVLVQWKGLRRRVPLWEGAYFAGCAQESLWAVSLDEAGKSMELRRLPLDAPGGRWETVGRVEGEATPFLLLPLRRSGRFLGISPLPMALPGGDRGSHAGVFRLSEGRLHLEDVLALPFGDAPHILAGRWTPQAAAADGTVPPSRWQGEALDPALVPNLMCPSLSPDHLVLGAGPAGILWFISLETGRLARTVDLFGLGKEDFRHTASLQNLILGTAFAPDGSLLVATRHPELVRLCREMPLSAGGEEGAARRRMLEAFEETYRDLAWFRIDPVTWRKERLEDEATYPSKMPSRTRHRALRILVDPLGRVRTNATTTFMELLETLPKAPLPVAAPPAPGRRDPAP